MADTDVEQLNELFAPNAKSGLEPDILAELQSTMRLHSIPPQELFYKWESYSMKIGSDMKLNLETARQLKKDVQDKMDVEMRSKAHVRSVEKRIGATPRNISNSGDVFGMLDNMAQTPRTGSNKTFSSAKRKPNPYDTPSISRVKQDPASSPPDFKPASKANGVAQSFNDRPNPGQTVEILNDHLNSAEPPIAPYSATRIKLTANTDTKKFSYKPMGMKQLDASEILDDRIDEFMLLVQAHYKLEDSNFGSAANKSINEVIAVGRIASDSSDGKLNTASLLIEMSRRMGAGLRVPLRVGNVPGFHFFPGQIVAVRGINLSGDEFIVSEVLDIPMLPVAASTPDVLESHNQRLFGGPDAMDSDSTPAPLNIMIGAGPYTADDNLDFEPLHAICSQAADSYADVLVLTGPFLDIDHPLIASGDFDLPEEALDEPDTATLATLFKYLVAPAFSALVASNPTVTVLLIPSTRDAISSHVSWPQEAVPKELKKSLGLSPKVRILSNPMTISLNEIVTGISSQDVLYDLRHEELTGGKLRDGNLLSRLPRYLIDQRHYFPVLPPTSRDKLPKTGTSEGIPTGAMLDLGYLKLGEIINVRPDLLIVPSALPPFAKVVESVLVINPGYLSKRKAAGTYAKLTVYASSMTDEEKAAGKFLAHKLFERARVDIIRI